MNKILVSVLGVSTVGKSSLLENVLEQTTFHAIPILLNRESRISDDKRLVRCAGEGFHLQELVLGSYAEGYGFRYEEFQGFIEGSAQFAITAMTFSNAREFKDLRQSDPRFRDIRAFNVLMKFTDSLSQDMGILEERLTGRFKDRDASGKRLELHQYLLRDYAFNDDYVRQNVDLTLMQKQGDSKMLSRLLISELDARFGGVNAIPSIIRTPVGMEKLRGRGHD